jgi:dihydrofolate reductase
MALNGEGRSILAKAKSPVHCGRVQALYQADEEARFMRKLYMFVMLSLDGYFEGPNHDISWHNVDDEFNKFAKEQLRKTDLFLWGRRTYQLMEGYWPRIEEAPLTSSDDGEIAHLMNSTEKIVFSKTLDRVEETKIWHVTKLVHEFDPKEIRRLKARPGKEIGVGGPDLAMSLIKYDLIDELRIMVNPVAIGEGTPMFRGLERRVKLELLETGRFDSGNILLCYRPQTRQAKFSRPKHNAL